jgi:hypothetical protein
MSIYEMDAPQATGSGKYLKFRDGDKHRVRMFGDPISYEATFEGQDPRVQIASLCLWKNPDTLESEVKVFQFGWTIQKALKALAKDSDWGDPTEFDIEIHATGEKLERKYNVVPKPKKDLTREEKKAIFDCDWDLKSLVTHGKSTSVPEKDVFEDE